MQGAIGIEEGSIRIRFTDGTIETLHSNDVSLDEPDSPLYDMVKKPIEIVYRPWEEVDENMKYKEDKKLQAKQAEAASGLFAVDTETASDEVSANEDDSSAE